MIAVRDRWMVEVCLRVRGAIPLDAVLCCWKMDLLCFQTQLRFADAADDENENEAVVAVAFHSDDDTTKHS